MVQTTLNNWGIKGKEKKLWKNKTPKEKLKEKLRPELLNNPTRAGLDSKTAKEKIHPLGKTPSDFWII